MVLSTAYLPPINWFARLLSGEPILIEQYENYTKQTIRNRCTIDSPNGPLNLTIPVDKSNFGHGGKCLMKDVRISSHLNWRHQHWAALESTYFNSPFFEYLQDDFKQIYNKEWTFLMDLNEALIEKCCELIDIQPQISRTTEFIPQAKSKLASYPQNIQDNTSSITREDREVGSYYQVFAHKHGFLPNISIIDLIFNMGPEGIFVLEKMNICQ